MQNPVKFARSSCFSLKQCGQPISGAPIRTKHKRWWRLILKSLSAAAKHTLFYSIIGLLLALPVLHVSGQSATPVPPQPAGPTLKAVLARGQVICGANQDLLGFGYLDPNLGDLKGFDIDLCRALAAAIFGDDTAVQLPLYTEADGVTALKSGEIDVLIRNVTWTLTADANNIDFGPVTFFNGQTFITRADSKFKSWADMDGATICIAENSPAESSLKLALAKNGVNAQLSPSKSVTDAFQAFVQGRCDAANADRVQLEILRQRSADPGAFRVWDTVYTHEPFAPVFRHSDDQWGNIVKWTVFGLIQAEELGITSENVESLQRQRNELDADYVKRVGPDIARLVDTSLGLGDKFGLKGSFMADVIRKVGNYGQIYDRNLGPTSNLPITRSLNNLAENGGLIYAPDWR